MDREALRLATFGLRGAFRKFPRALPRVVGDVDAWSAHLQARLDLLSPVIHGDAALGDVPTPARGPELPAWCRTELPWLATGLEGEPRFTQKEIADRMAPWRGALENTRRCLGHERALLLAGAVVSGSPNLPAAGGGLAALLADSRVFELPTHEGDARQALASRLAAVANDARTGHEQIASAVEGPEPEIGAAVVEFLAARPGALVVRLVTVLLGRTRLEEWSAWWESFRALEREARSELGRALTRDVSAADVRFLAKEWREHLEVMDKAPPAWSLESVQGLRQKAEALTDRATLESILRVVELVPDACSSKRRGRYRGHAPTEILEAWVEMIEEDLSPSRIQELAALAVRLLDQPQRTADDRTLLARAFTSFLVETAGPPPDYPWELRTLGSDALEELLALGEPGRGLLGAWNVWRASFRISKLLEAIGKKGSGAFSAAQAAKLALSAHEAELWSDVAFAVRLALSCPSVPAEQIFGAAAHLSEDDSALTGLRDLALQPGPAAFLLGLLLDGEIKLLQRLSVLAHAAAKLGADPTPPALTTVSEGIADNSLAWLPLDLRQDAAMLLDAAGQKALDRTLGDDFPRPERIAREAQALEAIAGRTSHQDARLEMLRRRLDNPDPPSSARLEAARARLARRLRGLRAAAWEEALRESLGPRLPDSLRPLLSSAESQATVGALAVLRPTIRRLAWRLLDGEDLSGEPAHVAWRVRMEERGLDLELWRSGDMRHESTSPEGRRLVFQLERDPLQVFQMGRWFGTCLSPGDINFFSVVANAADENKQLLVARDARGVVQARCLLALTARGQLLAFHVYAHEEQAWCKEQVHAIAVELGASVGATLVPRGRIERLVAPAWYDDGPTDLTGQLDSLQNGAVAEALEAAPPERARSILEKELGPELIEGAFDQIILKPILARSPERLLSLEPLLRRLRLTPWVAAEVMDSLRRASPDLARDVLLDAVRRRNGRSYELWGDSASALAQHLAELGEPSDALRLLRRQRAKGPRADRARAVALAALGRHGQAKRLLEPHAEGGDWDAKRLLERLDP